MMPCQHRIGAAAVDVSEPIGVVAALRRYPVKSMQGESLRSVTVVPEGVLGDRALAVVDRESGEVLRGKTPDLGPRLLACRASFAAAPRVGQELPPVSIDLPDGSSACSEAGDVDEVLTRYFERPVSLVTMAPPASAFVAGRAEFLDQAGVPALVDDASLRDASPVSVVTTSTLAALGAARPETLFDDRRFRMNVLVDSTTPGFAENTWPERSVIVGGGVWLRVALPTPRCVLTTMAQDGLPRDPAVLRTVARVNSVQVAGRSYPCVGAYATVDSVGEIRLDDPVSLV